MLPPTDLGWHGVRPWEARRRGGSATIANRGERPGKGRGLK